MGIITDRVGFLWGTGSLFLVAVKTGSLKTVFFKKPSIILGDFLILPIIGGLIVNILVKRETALFDLSSVVFYLSIVVGLLLAVFSAIRNQQLSYLWLPHILFYWLMAFFILYFLIVSFDLTLIAWWIVLIGVFVHQSLGIIYPKKFPRV